MKNHIRILFYSLFLSTSSLTLAFLSRAMCVRKALPATSQLKVNMYKYNADNEFQGGDNSNEMMQSQQQDMPAKSTVPSRFDVCRLLLSGVIGSDTKEAYLSNGHYVVNFGLAMVGHFEAVHEWEKQKPVETTWLSCEIWDDEAKAHVGSLRKGMKLSGLGTLILNKWVDKSTGEEKKMFKARILKVLTPEDLNDKLLNMGEPELTSSNASSFTENDSAFSQDHPPQESQFSPDEAMRGNRNQFNGSKKPPQSQAQWNEGRNPNIPF